MILFFSSLVLNLTRSWMLSFSLGKLAFRRDLIADIIPQKLRGQAFRLYFGKNYLEIKRCLYPFLVNVLP